MRNQIIIAIIIATLLILAGCSKKAADIPNLPKEKYTLESSLKEQEVTAVKAVKVQGSAVDVTYEASEADKYDSQLVADWVTIFATATEYDYTPITITNTVNDVPYVKMTTTQDNVINYLAGKENESEFWMNVEIKALK